MYYSLEKEKRTKPCVVTIKEQKLGILTDDKDAGFLAMAQQAFDKQLVSTVYFVGSAFDGGWMQESLKYICRGAEVEAYNASVLQAQSAAQAEQSQSGYRDGTYEGSAFGFGDVIRVSVTIQNGKMTDIAVLDASGEDKPYYKQALPLLDEMLAVQSAEVDTVSGATLTAEGLISAVEDALGKAAG